MLEGEVSHVEIPRTSQSLGVTIVGGADTPLVSEKERETDMGECCSTKEPILSLNGRQKTGWLMRCEGPKKGEKKWQ